jgi:hypothetical protein
MSLLEEGDLVAAVDVFAQAASNGSPGGNFYLGLAYDDLLGKTARGESVINVRWGRLLEPSACCTYAPG